MFFAFDKEDLDITNENQLRTKIEEIRPEVIINATAINAVDNMKLIPIFINWRKK
jgi:dTDP-4-dehydrorhamnose reductase